MNGWWIFAGHGRRRAALEVRDHASAAGTSSTRRTSGSSSASCCSGRSAPTRSPFWWGPMSAWIALALVIIVVGGLAILSRLHLLGIAVAFWVDVRGGHRRARRERARDDGALAPRPDRRARLLVDPRLLARDPRLPLLHDHRPEDDPRERARRAGSYAVAVGLLAVLLIAPQTTEFAAKVAVLGALTIVCAARPLLAARCRAAARRAAAGWAPRRALAARRRWSARPAFAGAARARRHPGPPEPACRERRSLATGRAAAR